MRCRTHRVDPDADLRGPERVPAPEVDPLLVAVAGDGEPDVAVLIVGILHEVLEGGLDLRKDGNTRIINCHA